MLLDVLVTTKITVEKSGWDSGGSLPREVDKPHEETEGGGKEENKIN